MGAVALLVGLTACREDQPRTYKEVAFKPLARAGSVTGDAMAGTGPGSMGMGGPMANASPVDIKVTWKAPEDWLRRDSAGTMRVGSFAIPDPKLANTGEADPKAVDVSVVQLAGTAGGLEANIARWMGQVGLIATRPELEEFIKAAEKLKIKSGQEALIIDLTSKLSGDMTQSKSIYGAIIMKPEYTVFVKAAGERTRLVAEKNRLKAFCESLAIQEPAGAPGSKETAKGAGA